MKLSETTDITKKVPVAHICAYLMIQDRLKSGSASDKASQENVRFTEKRQHMLTELFPRGVTPTFATSLTYPDSLSIIDFQNARICETIIPIKRKTLPREEGGRVRYAMDFYLTTSFFL